jgi:hypothetical protein
MSGKINWADIARKAAPEPPKTAKPASPPPEPELPKLDSNGQVVASKPKPKPEPRPDPHTLFNAELPNMGNTAPVVAPKGAWGKKPAAAPTAAAGSGKQPAAVAADESAAGADGEQTKAVEQAAVEEKKQKQPRAVEAVDPNLVPLDKRDEDNVKVEKKKGKKRAPQTSSPPPEAPASQPEATTEEPAASDASPAAEVHAEPEPVPEPEPVHEAEKTPQPAALEPAVIESPQRPVAHHADPHHRPATAAASAVVEPPRRENDSMETSSPFHQPPDMVGAWSDVPTPAFDFNLNPTNFGFGAYQNNQAHAEPQSAPLHPRLHVAEHLSKAFARRNETKVQLRAPHREPEAPSELQRRADDLATRERDLSRREADLTKARHEVDVKLHSLKAREGELEAQRREVAAEKLRLEQERKAHGEQVSAHDAQRTRELREIQQQREAINRERVQVAPVPQPEVPYGRGAPAAHEGYGHGEPRQSTWHGPAMSGRDHHSHHAHHHHHHAHHQYQQDEVDYYGYSAGYQHQHAHPRAPRPQQVHPSAGYGAYGAYGSGYPPPSGTYGAGVPQSRPPGPRPQRPPQAVPGARGAPNWSDLPPQGFAPQGYDAGFPGHHGHEQTPQW